MHLGYAEARRLPGCTHKLPVLINVTKLPCSFLPRPDLLDVGLTMFKEGSVGIFIMCCHATHRAAPQNELASR